MNRIKRILGFRNVLERAWAETQVESPDTVMLGNDADAAEAMESMRQAYLAKAQGEQHATA